LRPRAGKKIVLLGMMTRIPVAGVVWQTVHYLLGLERLGYEVYYVETHARTPSMLMEREEDDSSAEAAAFIDRVMRRFDLGDRWAFVGLHDDGRYYGLSEQKLHELYRSAALLINLHGGTEPRPELYATDRLVYLETDPVQLQVELEQNVQASIDFLEPHCAFFTYAENYGNPDCGLPIQHRFPLHRTRQPVVMDFWRNHRAGSQDRFTTVGNWRQPWRDVTFRGEVYSWSKHHEFLKFIDLPARTGQAFELALSSYEPEDRQMLEDKGWSVVHALDFSTDTDAYRDYIAGSRGEFSVAKDQNVRLRTGWFSDRSATYLAAGRPVVCQDTAFTNVMPTGEGLFGFSTMEEAEAAVEQINSDYERHSRAATAVAEDVFNSDEVLSQLLADVGLERSRLRHRLAFQRAAELFPADMSLTPLSRRPTKLPEPTERAVLERTVPAFGPVEAGPVGASVVVVTYDNLAFTRMCLESVLADRGRARHELVVVDNGSTDGTPEYLRELAESNPNVRIVLNTVNGGFARACNQGLAASSGAVIVLLNNDTLVPPGWLTRLSGWLGDPTIGLVGPLTNRIGNEAEIDVPYETWAGLVEFAAERSREYDGESFELDTLTMFCLAMRRETYERLGPLDQQFALGLLEDDDYSARAREAGYRLVCAEDVFVHHFGESSFGKLIPTGEYGELLLANQKRFEQKWGRPWQPYGRGSKPLYEALTERIRSVVAEALPAEGTVLVVSRGDEELLKLAGHLAWHFPGGPDGTWVGHHPKDSGEAVALLEEMRERGGRFVLFPKTGLWWLDYYEGLREHLESRYEIVVRDEETCIIFALNGA
jgi:GT2 family glycosyltransferase